MLLPWQQELVYTTDPLMCFQSSCSSPLELSCPREELCQRFSKSGCSVASGLSCIGACRLSAPSWYRLWCLFGTIHKSYIGVPCRYHSYMLSRYRLWCHVGTIRNLVCHVGTIHNCYLGYNAGGTLTITFVMQSWHLSTMQYFFLVCSSTRRHYDNLSHFATVPVV